jgi:HK97 family phage prohead protease
MPLLVRGFASVFGNKDSYGEVVDKGAFTKWIAKNPETSLPLFWQHAHIWDSLAKPIGHTTKIKETARGLYYEASIADTPEGLEVQELVKSGAVKAASFAYKIVTEEMRKSVRHLVELDIKEITAANWGANDRAYIEPIPGQETPDE